MPAPSFTYTLTNSTTADASQVMQNFNDILNGVSDGSKDLSINALTCASTATFNSNVVVGNASSDTLTVTASLASHLVPSADGTYDFGTAALGFRALYVGDGGGDTVKIVAASLAADRIFTLPDLASADFVVTQGTQTISGTKTFDGQLIGKGTTAADSAAASYIGEYIEDSGSTNLSASAFASTGASLSLTAGDWDVSGGAYISYVSYTTVTGPAGLRYDVDGANGSTASKDLVQFQNNAASTGGIQFIMPVYRHSSASSQTVALEVNPGTATSCTVSSFMIARRVR